jgi:putative tricarboxylic transport membrane protein
VLAAYESFWTLGMGEIKNPGPGFMPFLVCFSLVLFSGYLFIIDRPKVDVWSLAKLIKGAGVAAAIPIAGFAMEVVGFRIMTFFLMCLLLRLFGSPKWSIIIGLSIIIALGVDFLFSSVGLILPRSLWGI